ncbi:MAG: hypothetical protein ABJC26_16890 [Gemmatimonadaceae bacterium]
MWYRSWLEVRWRLVLMTLVNAFIVTLLLDDPVPFAAWEHRLSGNLPFLFAMNAIVLAGCGLASQISQRPGQVVHSSMMFILSLPITRKKLVLVREAVGALGSLALVYLTFFAFWLGAPSLREGISAEAITLYLVSVTAFVLVAYAVSAMLSAVLDQLWQTYGAMAALALAFGAIPTARFWTSVFAEPSGDARGALMVVTIGSLASILVATGLVFLSVQIVQRKQF